MKRVTPDALRKAGSIMRVVGNGNKASLFDAAASTIDAMQARIDELMLEYCPDEMTPEQMAEWARHQTASAPEGEV